MKRRTLLLLLLAGSAGLPALLRPPRPARGQSAPPPPPAAAAPMVKVSQEEAGYIPKARDIRSCAMCTLFVRPRACTAVEGDISPDGWCKLFDMVD